MNDDIQLATQQVVYNLKKIREEKNISQLELAHRAGISQNMVTYIETGKRSPTLQTLIKLCVALEVSPSKLFTEEKTEKKRFHKTKDYQRYRTVFINLFLLDQENKRTYTLLGGLL